MLLRPIDDRWPYIIGGFDTLGHVQPKGVWYLAFL